LKLSFIISVYNEQDSIDTLCHEIIANIPKHSDYEIIFVDDGSTDKSFEIMQKLSLKNKSIKIIKFQRNFGKASAIQKGFEESQGEIVFTLDADLQDDPNQINLFLQKLDEGYDMVSGWKKKRNDPIGKRVPSKIFNFVVSRFFRMHLHDYNCGFKAYKAKVVKSLHIYGEMHRYIPILAKAKGFSCGEVIVNHRKRIFGISKYGIERYLRGFLDFLTIRVITKYKKSPIYFFGGIGFVTFLLGFALGVYLIFIKYFLHQGISGRPLLMLSVLLAVIGMQFISIGLIGEIVVNQKGKDTGDIEIEKTVNLENKNV